MSWRRNLSKTVYVAAGYLSRVKTPQRTYETGHPRWVWMPCEVSNRLLAWSMDLDWDHWDHWALYHPRSAGPMCPVCGGFICEDDEGAP